MEYIGSYGFGLPKHEPWFLFCRISLHKLPLPRRPSAILPRVALVVFFASVFRGCFREGLSADFRDRLPRKGFQDFAKISMHALFS